MTQDARRKTQDARSTPSGFSLGTFTPTPLGGLGGWMKLRETKKARGNQKRQQGPENESGMRVSSRFYFTDRNELTLP